MKFYLIIFGFTLIVGCSNRSNDVSGNQERKIKSVIIKMNNSLASHRLDQLLICYSKELDWENSFGWTIRGKANLNRYFKDQLFPKYPKLDTVRIKLNSAVEFINAKTAWIDVQQEIYSEDMKTIARTYRQTHLIIKSGDGWLIKKTRMWLPQPSDNPPSEFLSSHKYFNYN